MEWVALNVFDSTSTSFMGSSPSVAPNIHVLPLNYTWINQKSVHLAAQTAIDYVMTWVFDVFPTKSGHDFPQTFPSTIKYVYHQLLRVFAHKSSIFAQNPTLPTLWRLTWQNA